MKKEYDFSKGERGRFYKPHTALDLPVYLDKKNRAFVERLAESRNTDVSTIVNELIRSRAGTNS